MSAERGRDASPGARSPRLTGTEGVAYQSQRLCWTPRALVSGNHRQGLCFRILTPYGQTPMALLEQKISAGKTVVTAELTPPKGTDLTELLAKADALRPYVDAINLTESARARLTVDPRAVARLLLDHGIEPIVQVTARDRNRIAIQADLLGAAVLGVSNLPSQIRAHPSSPSKWITLAAKSTPARASYKRRQCTRRTR